LTKNKAALQKDIPISLQVFPKLLNLRFLICYCINAPISTIFLSIADPHLKVRRQTIKRTERANIENHGQFPPFIMYILLFMKRFRAIDRTIICHPYDK